jgi:hypothetical protein
MSVAETTKEMALTKDVLDNHLKCFSEGDLKGILSDYSGCRPVHVGRTAQGSRRD